MTRAEKSAIAWKRIEDLTLGNGEGDRLLAALCAILDVAEAPAERIKIEPGEAPEWDGLPQNNY